MLQITFSEFNNSRSQYTSVIETKTSLCPSPRFNLSLHRNSSKSVHRFSLESLKDRHPELPTFKFIILVWMNGKGFKYR